MKNGGSGGGGWGGIAVFRPYFATCTVTAVLHKLSGAVMITSGVLQEGCVSFTHNRLPFMSLKIQMIIGFDAKLVPS